EIQCFMERALIDRAVAKEAERDAIFVAIFRRESHPHSEWDVRCDNRMPAIHVVLLVEIMHRATKSTRTAGRLPEKLGHASVRARAASERMGVISVRRNK